MVSGEKYDHPLYKHCNENEADAIAWAFVNTHKMVLFPFKFPPLGPKELRANVLYSGLCRSDLSTVREEWGPTFHPLTPGHEIIAEVSMVGSEVIDFKKGDLVGFGTRRDCCGKCNACKDERENICTFCPDKKTFGRYWGGYATQIQQPAGFFFHLPKNFNLKLGAPLLCAGITTYYPMKRFLKKGMNTAVFGVGGLGHLAIKFLNKLGHKVTGFTGTPEKKEFIKQFGADEVINEKDTNEMERMKNTFDFVINTVPTNEHFEQYLHTMAAGGTFVNVGIAAFEKTPIQFTAAELVVKELNVCGSAVGPKNAIKDMLPFCADNDIYPMCEEYEFENFPKAFEKLDIGRPKFRCVVNVGSYAEKHGWKR